MHWSVKGGLLILAVGLGVGASWLSRASSETTEVVPPAASTPIPKVAKRTAREERIVEAALTQLPEDQRDAWRENLRGMSLEEALGILNLKSHYPLTAQAPVAPQS